MTWVFLSNLPALVFLLTEPPQILFIKYEAYSKPSSIISLSSPRSKRYLASELIPSFLPVFAT